MGTVDRSTAMSIINALDPRESGKTTLLGQAQRNGKAFSGPSVNIGSVQKRETTAPSFQVFIARDHSCLEYAC